MAINVNANSATPIITTVPGAVNHDVIDFSNGKAYRQIQVSDAMAAGDVMYSAYKTKEGDHIDGIAVATVSSGNYGFFQSFGFCQAKVATGTPANSFLVPSSTAGVLRKLDLTGAEAQVYVLRSLDQRDQISGTFTDHIRLVVSLTAESGGLANVFIF